MATMAGTVGIRVHCGNEVLPAARVSLAKNLALFFAAPFIGLAYIVAFPFVGTAALVRALIH